MRHGNINSNETNSNLLFWKISLFLSHCSCTLSSCVGRTAVLRRTAVLTCFSFLRAFSRNASGRVALSPRKERRPSWNTLNSWATSLAEADWSRTWHSTGHHLGWVPTVLHIIYNSFILCSWYCDQYTRYSHGDVASCGWERTVHSIKRCVGSLCCT